MHRRLPATRFGRLPWGLSTFALLVLLAASSLAGQAPTPAPRPEQTSEFNVGQLDFGKFNNQRYDFQQTPSQFQPIIVETILDLVPKDYENTKKWGTTKEIVSGLNVKLRDGQIRTKRRRKEVNHGTWKRYNVTLVDPKEFFELKVQDLHEESPGLAAFNLVVHAKLDVYGRLQEWKRGVRIFSISADATADVELNLDCRLTTKLDASKLPPDILMQPEVVAAKAKLVQLELERLGKANGPLVHEFGDGLEKILRKKLAEKNEKLASKINRQIKKNEDDMRISFRDMLSSGLFGKDEKNDEEDPEETTKETTKEKRTNETAPTP